ncbi:MAG TPA: hypothetical protein IAC50_05045 [Candidatus Copromorpha excrementigallinarum]|uniref:Right handed beta helix domain-containing protein n=1 Tax=Candidatus Allocopromorpha excrementigallinarum TaxID=2840742 RepID=A0A9D1I072_9FIRM|nr:hypothetical protein [Candidatus Copromorpha excrementigallinarum]
MIKTRKSLWAAGFALLVCIALLIGTTLAWFTDSVSNRGNKIQAGTLQIDLLQLGKTLSDSQKEALEEETISEDTFYSIAALENVPVFDYDNWEPGYSTPEVFQIKNNGTLALKYQLDLILQEGQTSKLADVINVWFKTGNEAITSVPTGMNEDQLADDGYTEIGTLSSILNNEHAATGYLSEGQSDYAAIVLYMDESAGNDYKNLSIGGTFDIVLSATQQTEETDGFGSDQYDAGADDILTRTWVSNTDDMQTALDNGEKVLLTDNISANFEDQASSDVNISRIFKIKAGSNIDLGGNTVNIISNSGRNGIYFAEEGKEATISNGSITLNYSAGTSQATVMAEKSTLILEGVTITANQGGNNDGPYAVCARGYAGTKIVLKDCIVNGNIMVGSGAELEAENTTINGLLNVANGGKASLTNSTYTNSKGSGTITEN